MYRVQQSYFNNFLQDIDESAYKMDLAQRTRLYAQCSEEAFWAGAVLSDLSNDVYWKWVNGLSEHCVDCTMLAKGGRWKLGVYSAQELAHMGVFPGSGKLSCCTNCKCKLVRVPRPDGRPKGKPWMSVKLVGPGYSSLEGGHRSDRSVYKQRIKRATWNFKKRLTKALFTEIHWPLT